LAAFDGIAASPESRSAITAFPNQHPSCVIHFSLPGKIEYLFKNVKFSMRLASGGANFEGDNIIAGIMETKYKYMVFESGSLVAFPI
jgi:hypothetical protein